MVQATQAPTAPAQQVIDLERASSILDQILDKAASVRGDIRMTADGVEFGDFAGVQRYARMMVDCGCVPIVKDDTPHAQLARATMCILLGRRVGLAPEQAVTSIYVVNCRPVIFGDAPLAIARQHPSWVEAGFREYFEVDGQPVKGEPPPEAFKKEATACVCETLRKGATEPMVSRFSMAHAKTAGLLGRNAALYGGYPQRMLRFRARGYCLRDNFGDALKGIGIRELVDPEELGTPAAPEVPTGRVSLRKPTGNGERASQETDEASPSPRSDEGQPAVVHSIEPAVPSSSQPDKPRRKTKAEMAVAVAQQGKPILPGQVSRLQELQRRLPAAVFDGAFARRGIEPVAEWATLSESQGWEIMGELLTVAESGGPEPREDDGINEPPMRRPGEE